MSEQNVPRKMHVKSGDTVVVLSGKDKGKTGKVLAVSPKEGKVIVEGVNMVTKHVKPRKMGDAGGIVKVEGALYSSKVQLVDPTTGKGARAGHKFVGEGAAKKKIRISKKSGEEF